MIRKWGSRACRFKRLLARSRSEVTQPSKVFDDLPFFFRRKTRAGFWDGLRPWCHAHEKGLPSLEPCRRRNQQVLGNMAFHFGRRGKVEEIEDRRSNVEHGDFVTDVPRVVAYPGSGRD